MSVAGPSTDQEWIAAGREKPLRILIYGLNFAPELTGVGRYTADMALWLKAQGHDVRIVTSVPYYPEWKVHRGYRNRWTREYWQGIRVVRCPTIVRSKPTTLNRIALLATFAITSTIPLILEVLRFRPNLLWTVEPTVFGTPNALVAAKLVGATTWLHVQDIEVGAAISVGLVRQGIGLKLIKFAYALILRNFDYVSTLSNTMRDMLTKFGRHPTSIAIFPNWIDVDRSQEGNLDELRARLGLKVSDFVVMYAGAIGEKQGIQVLIDAIQILEQHKNIRFVVIGAGSAKDQLESSLLHRQSLLLLNPQPESEFRSLLAMADCHLLLQRSGITKYVMPSKLAPMLATGMRIIAQADENCEVRQLLLHSSSYLISPGDPRALACKILDASLHRPTEADIARNRELATSFSREVTLSNVFSHVLSPKPRFWETVIKQST